MSDQDKVRRAREKAGEGGAKQPYRKPRLVEYGSVAKLTQGTRTFQSDAGGGGFKMSCF